VPGKTLAIYLNNLSTFSPDLALTSINYASISIPSRDPFS